MSNSVGQGLLLSTLLEHQIKANPNGGGGNTSSLAQGNSQIRRFCLSSSPSLLSSDFRGRILRVRKSTLLRCPLASGVTQAVLATDPASESKDSQS